MCLYLGESPLSRQCRCRCVQEIVLHHTLSACLSPLCAQGKALQRILVVTERHDFFLLGYDAEAEDVVTEVCGSAKVRHHRAAKDVAGVLFALFVCWWRYLHLCARKTVLRGAVFAHI